jgi:hypothetical protein
MAFTDLLGACTDTLAGPGGGPAPGSLVASGGHVPALLRWDTGCGPLGEVVRDTPGLEGGTSA